MSDMIPRDDVIAALVKRADQARESDAPVYLVDLINSMSLELTAITTIRAQLAEARAERDDAMALFHATEKEWKARADKAEAALYQHEHAEKEGLTVSSMACQLMIAEAQAAQIEADASACDDACLGLVNIGATSGEIVVAKGLASYIRAQPHASTALDAVKWAAKVEAWREAAAIVTDHQIQNGYDGSTLMKRRHGTIDGLAYATAILALIEREGV